MSEFLGYLQRLSAPPSLNDLSDDERAVVTAHFDHRAAELYVDDHSIDWQHLDEVEVVKAARAGGVSGWLIKQMLGDDRYHVGLYHGRQEAVITNIPLNVARYIVQTIAYHAPNPVRYKGIEGLSPIANA